MWNPNWQEWGLGGKFNIIGKSVNKEYEKILILCLYQVKIKGSDYTALALLQKPKWMKNYITFIDAACKKVLILQQLQPKNNSSLNKLLGYYKHVVYKLLFIKNYKKG